MEDTKNEKMLDNYPRPILIEGIKKNIKTNGE